jgi:hypothetical protein
VNQWVQGNRKELTVEEAENVTVVKETVTENEASDVDAFQGIEVV